MDCGVLAAIAAETRELAVGESWSEGSELAMGYTFEADATAGGVLEPYLDGADDLNISIRTWPALELSPIERP